MTHPRTRTARSLLGVTLVLLGLSTYGCGDTGTGTEPAVLGSLSASDGILEPPFNPATTAYTVKLFGSEASTTITVSPQVTGDTVQINNQQRTSQTVTLASIGASEVLNIVVTDTGTGGTSKAYSVRVSREEEDTTLSNLSSPQGTVAPSPFDKSELAPSINGIGNGVTTITLTATKSDPNTVMVIEAPTNPVTVLAGTPSGDATVQLGGPGSATKVPIVITGPKGGKTTYVVTINRGASNNSLLKNLTISPGAIRGFKARTTTYDVNVLSGVGTVTVTATPEDSAAKVTITPQPITLLDPGNTTLITVRVTAQDGTTQTDYKINVIRAALNGNNNLKSLSIAPGRLDFKVNQPKYDVNVLSGVGTVTVTATPEDSAAKITILRSGATITSQPITLLGPGDPTPITVRVTAQNGKSQDYTINVIRAALNGNTDLKSLTVSPGSLSFDQNDLSYDVNLLSNVTSVQITAAPEDGAATVAINNGQPQPISLGAPGPEVRVTVPVVVTAQNQKDKKTYNILFIRAALGGNNNLSALTVTPADSFTPALNNTTTEYEANVGSTVGSVTVRASKADVNAVMSGDVTAGAGTRTNEATIQLGAPGPVPTVVRIRVTAPNGAPKDYRIEVFKALPSSNANLSALRVTAGSSVTNFSSPFDQTTVTVAPETEEVVVRATKEQENATMAIGGNTVSPGTNSGQATFPLNGSGGEPTTISFTVTAQDGVTVKTYTISVIRPAAPTPPAKPAIAPDLITTDDSCPLDQLDKDQDGITDECFLGSNDDNITGVLQPRFTVAAPPGGTTPNLYIDGVKVKEGFDQGTNTLTPSTPLSGNSNGIPHSITSTVTDTATKLESEQSEALSVTIRTGGQPF